MIFVKGNKFPESGINRIKETFKKRKELGLHIGTKRTVERKIINCLNCSTEILVLISSNKKFCSKGCGSSYNNRKRWSDKEKKEGLIQKIRKVRKANGSYHTGSLKAIQTRRRDNNLHSWNKGLTKETDCRVRQASEKESKSKMGISWERRMGAECAAERKRKARYRLTGMVLDKKLNLNYGVGWLRIRECVLIRDNHTCCVCNIEKAEKVHHVVPYRIIKKHRKSLLVSVCKKCHLKVEPKNIPTEEITFGWYINYYTSKGGKLPLETTRRTSEKQSDDIVQAL